MEKDEIAEHIGTRARAARLSLDLTQQDAAERIGVSIEFYSRVERGRAVPSVLTLTRMVHALGISADSLIGTGDETSYAEPKRVYGFEDPPELRRLVRRLRKEKPRTLKLIGQLVTEMARQRAEVRRERA